MIFDEKNPPRCYPVGNTIKFDMKDCGAVALDDNEQITFVTLAGGEYDVAKKDWGFYATPSLNGRLAQFNLRPVMIRNTLTGRYFIFLVERSKEDAFEVYRVQECLEIISWLDTTERLDALATAVKGIE